MSTVSAVLDYPQPWGQEGKCEAEKSFCSPEDRRVGHWGPAEHQSVKIFGEYVVFLFCGFSQLW